MTTVPLICIDRHRLTIDGEGVATLVAFHGCPLHCKYYMNPAIYQAYTGKSNQQVIDNLVWLSTHAKHKDKIIIRLPLIPQFNTPEDRERSKQALRQMGFERFDEFEYNLFLCKYRTKE